MIKLTPTAVEIYKTRYLGKKIRVIDGDGKEWVGICKFIGYNKLLPSYGFQVTINRTPVTNVDPTKITLVLNRQKF